MALNTVIGPFLLSTIRCFSLYEYQYILFMPLRFGRSVKAPNIALRKKYYLTEAILLSLLNSF